MPHFRFTFEPVMRQVKAQYVVGLIERMVTANPLWRALRIHAELKMLGIEISKRTVSRILRTLRRPPTQTWKTYFHNHLDQLMSIDFFTVPTVTMRVLFACSPAFSAGPPTSVGSRLRPIPADQEVRGLAGCRLVPANCQPAKLRLRSMVSIAILLWQN